MISNDHIRNPMEWTADQLRTGGEAVSRAGQAVRGSEAAGTAAQPTVRRISTADLGHVIAQGFADFTACRSDVIFLCIIYPLSGLLLAWLTFGYDALPLLFPLVSGFALVGPIAAIGLYEISRRRERGDTVAWADAFGVARSPAFGAILVLGLILLAVFAVWLIVAYAIFRDTVGPEAPASIGGFLTDVLTTRAGLALIVIGCGVGFLFAGLVLTISVVSFPLLLDRDVGVRTAVLTSARAVRTNPGPMALWGLIVVAGLALGSLPVLLGLVIVMPVLGHATWHLYRRLVVPSPAHVPAAPRLAPSSGQP